ncbi:MAG: ABC transporter substrate-binding protein [Huintestinicola sp.]
MKKNLFTKIISIAVTAAVASAVFTGCGKVNAEVSTGETTSSAESSAAAEKTGNDRSEKVTVRLADQSTSFTLIFSFAQEKGYFDKAFADDNVEIVINDFASGPVLNEAFAAGEVDISTLGTFPFLSGFDNDYGYRIIGKSNYTDYFPLIAASDSGVETAADLKGRTLGTAIGGQYHYLLLKHLEKAGLTADDVDIINSSTDTPTMIRSKDIVGTALSSTVVNQLVNEGAAYILEESPDDIIAGYIIATDEFTSKNPGITQKLLNAVSDALSDIRANPDIYSSFISEKTGADKENLDLFVSKQHFEIDVTDVDIKSISDEFEYMKSQSFITNTEATADDWINREFLDDLNK